LLRESRTKRRSVTFAARASLQVKKEPLSTANINREAARLRKLASRANSGKRKTSRHRSSGSHAGRAPLQGLSEKSVHVAPSNTGEVMGPNTPNPHPAYRRTERTVTVEHYGYDDELPEDLQGLDEEGDDDAYGPEDAGTD
jgi:hypothetical protein